MRNFGSLTQAGCKREQQGARGRLRTRLAREWHAHKGMPGAHGRAREWLDGLPPWRLAGCRTLASYGDMTESKARYCSRHKLASNVHTYLRHCSAPTCGRWASFASPASAGLGRRVSALLRRRRSTACLRRSCVLPRMPMCECRRRAGAARGAAGRPATSGAPATASLVTSTTEIAAANSRCPRVRCACFFGGCRGLQGA